MPVGRVPREIKRPGSKRKETRQSIHPSRNVRYRLASPIDAFDSNGSVHHMPERSRSRQTRFCTRIQKQHKSQSYNSTGKFANLPRTLLHLLSSLGTEAVDDARPTRSGPDRQGLLQHQIQYASVPLLRTLEVWYRSPSTYLPTLPRGGRSTGTANLIMELQRKVFAFT